MKKFLRRIDNIVDSFIKEEEGSQVVEYALIIAVASIGLVLALGTATGGLQGAFAALVTRVTTCFNTSTC